MKQIISIAVVVCLLFAIVPAVRVNATTDVQVRVSDISNAQRGDVVDVHIYLDNNPGLFAIGLRLDIDTNVFQRMPSTATAVAAPGPFMLGALSAPEQHPATIAMAFEGPYNDANTNYTGRIATIPLRVRDDALMGSLATALTLVPHAGGPLNIDFQVPSMTIVQGSVTVVPTPLPAVHVRVADIPNAVRGDIINVNIYLDQNPGLFALGLALTVDPNVLQRQPSTADAVAAPGPFILGALAPPEVQPIRLPLPLEGPYNDANTNYTGRIATIPFLVLADAPLDGSAITLEAHAGGALNINFEVPPLVVANGTVTVVEPTVPTPTAVVGVQSGTLRAGQAGTVTFPVTTTHIANGAYAVTVAGLPNGVSVQGQVTINNGSGTLTLAGTNAIAAGTHNNLRLTIDNVTTAPFTLTIAAAAGGGDNNQGGNNNQGGGNQGGGATGGGSVGGGGQPQQPAQPQQPLQPQEPTQQPPLQPQLRLQLIFTVGQAEFLLHGMNRTAVGAPFLDAATDRLMIPLRTVAEATGTNVRWDDATRSAVIYLPTGTLVIPVDQPLPDGMGSTIIVNDRVFVPARFVMEALGANDVRWYEPNQQAIISWY